VRSKSKFREFSILGVNLRKSGKRGDILVIRSCGAYAESMSLRYNGREAIGNNLEKKIKTTLRLVKTA
jgi:hypothetical protein